MMALNSDLVSECVDEALRLLNLFRSSMQEFILKKEQEYPKLSNKFSKRGDSSTHFLTKSLFNTIERTLHA